MYTVKKIIPEPVTMNSDNNKQKRKDYVQKLMTDIGAGKLIIYIYRRDQRKPIPQAKSR